MKKVFKQDLGLSIVDHRTGKRMYVRERLRQMKKHLEQAPYDHYYQDRDEANAAYEDYARELPEDSVG